VFRVWVAAVAVVALLLAGFSVWSNAQEDFAASDHAHTLKKIAADDAFDNDPALFSEDSSLVVIDSVRPLYVSYVDGEGKSAGVVLVPAVVVSDQYVIASRFVMPGEGFSINLAALLAVPEDRGAAPEILGAPTAVDEALNLVAFPRPEKLTLAAVPVSLGASAEVSPGNQLMVPTVHAFGGGEKTAPLGLVTALLAGNARYRLAGGNSQTFFMNATPAGTPVYALRDGVPELVGMTTSGGSQGLSAVITVELIADYLRHLGVSNNSQP